MAAWEWEEYFRQLELLVSDIETSSVDKPLLLQRTNDAIVSLQLIEIQVNVQNKDTINQILNYFYTMLQLLRSAEHQNTAIFHVQPPEKQLNGRAGRPKFLISKDILLLLKETGYSWKDIANLILVSRATVHRRAKEFDLYKETAYSDLSDEQLDEIILQYKRENGYLGGRSIVLGYLRSIGLKVQQVRVTKSLARFDPDTSRIRWALVIKRRKYNVPGPNHLWHIDGHHSLIQWGFVIHGSIDGYSRLITFLKCSTNNRKETVGELFLSAVRTYGVPIRIRTDKGGENIETWSIMENLRGTSYRSYLVGSSVRNQRIERLWRDVWIQVCHLFYYVFQAMEAEGILDIERSDHMSLLHFIFLPRINKVLNTFTKCWNLHPVRTERNWTPTKLWTDGMIDARNSNLIESSEVLLQSFDEELYGFDPDAPSPPIEEGDTVIVEDVPNCFSEEQQNALEMIDVLSSSDHFGIDIFEDAKLLLDL